MEKRLLIGAGEWAWKDWVTLDADPSTHPDVVAVVPPFPTAVAAIKWDLIMGIHVIEHVTADEGFDLVQQCYQCLAPKGQLILECPDVSYCAKVILGLIKSPPEEFPQQYGLAGIVGGGGTNNPWLYHKWGYTPVTLMALLVRAGFDPALVRVEAAQYHQPVRDFRVVGTKGNGI